MSIIDGKILLTKNDCYKSGKMMIPKGIVVHSTGANNPNLSRYIAPDDGVIGANKYSNDWNRSGLDVCVHGFLGKDKNGKVKFYQTLPFEYCCWGCGSGSKGSYNYNPAYIQFEMCEDDLKDKTYFNAVYDKAVEVCAYLCSTYNINVKNIVSHKEACKLGYASNHGDPENWFSKHNKTMTDFRDDVKKKMLSPSNKILTTNSGYLRSEAWYDDEGGTSKKICSVPKGVEVDYLEDDEWGWGKLRYNKQTGWMQNTRVGKNNISTWRTATFKENITCEKVKESKTKKAFTKGQTANLISLIYKGKYAGKAIINSGGVDYYVSQNKITIGGKKMK